IKRILIGGLFANDVAARLLFAGVPDNRLIVKPNLDELMAALYEQAVGNIYTLTCFTDAPKFTKRLKGAAV
ncbi:MAG: hypothetical protein RRY38_00630, partial [Oscillospiraceae bacterium]